jgi:predicted permease
MNSTTTLIINKVLPILLLLSIGVWIRKKQFIAPSAIDDLRKIVVNLALPAVLFLSFLNIEMKLNYVYIILLVFILCVSLFIVGKLLHRWVAVQHEYFPFLMTGFEYGMLGISLFGSAYGLENIGYIAVVDLGHELFIWFVFLAFLFVKRNGTQKFGELVTSFFKAPVIIGILAGVGINLLGWREFLYQAPISGGILNALDFLTGLTVPLILIIVGYGIRFDQHKINESVGLTTLRLGILIPLAFFLSVFVLGKWMMLEPGFQVALFTLMILPPPFIIPLYMHPDNDSEHRYVNNTLMIYTLVSIVIFTLFFILNPTI